MESSLQNFKVARFEFCIQATDRLSLPEYKGSAFRGGFGHAFKKVVCALRNKECRDCLLREKCIYSYIFETPPPADSRFMRKYPAAPHPFVLCPPLEDDRIYDPGEILAFQLTLIGKAMDYLPYFVYTFEELGQMGIGKGRGKFRVEEVKAFPFAKGKSGKIIYSGSEQILHKTEEDLWTQQISPPPIFPDVLRLSFLTPARLKFGEDLVNTLDFHVLFRNLIRRISLLSYFHCGYQLEADFRQLIHEAAGIRTKNSTLRWYDWERYSGRQQERMKLGGLIGEITYTGELSPFFPYLQLGELIHVGKGTSFGLGKYEILRMNEKQ
jgi:CRISPR-associated endoribonuclease Cas6